MKVPRGSTPIVFPGFSNRFFYFTTLGTSRPASTLSSPSVFQQAVNLRAKAEGYLSGFGISKQGIVAEDSNTMKNALNFLHNAAAQEAANETYFFKDLLKQYPEFAKSKLGKTLLSCFLKDGSINYPLFIDTLKTIENGREEVEKILNQTGQQYSILNSELTRANRDKAQNMTNQHNVRAQLSNLYRKENFAETKRTSSRSLALQLTSVFTNAINGLKLSPDAAAVTQYVQNNFLSILGVKKTTIKDPAINKAYVLDMSLKVSELAADMLKQNGQKDPKREDIYKKALEIMQNLNQDKKNLTGAQQKNLDELKKHANQLLNSLDLLEQQTVLTSGVEGKYLKISNANNITGLTKPIRQRLENLLTDYVGENNKKLSELKKIGEGGLGTKAAKEKYMTVLISILKRIDQNIEIGLKDEIEKSNFVSTVNKFLSRKTSMTMYTETELQAARGEAAVLQAIGEKVASKITGGSLGKADVITLLLGKVTAEMDDYPADLGKELIEEYDKVYEKRRKEILEEEREKATRELDEQAQKIFGSVYNSENAYSVRADYEAHQAGLKALYSALQKNLKLTDTQLNDLLSKLNSAFLIENSVKHSDYYINDFGFHGGSLGGGLYEQINNICDMAALGGVSTADRDWLIFAVMNCGNGLIGSGLKPTLENYFTTFASLLMFRSGSELAQQVQASAQELVASSTAGATMRLYTFQGQYVPASYLLNLTLQALEPAAAQIENQAASTIGNRAVIQNSIAHPEIHPWPGPEAFTNFAAENYGAVSINMQLLVGFMSVLNALQNAVNNIPI